MNIDLEFTKETKNKVLFEREGDDERKDVSMYIDKDVIAGVKGWEMGQPITITIAK